MKRFVVDEQVGIQGFHDGEVSWQYQHHWFDTEEEAQRFVDNHPRKECFTKIIDTENIPF